MTALALHWAPRWPPLAPEFVMARGAPARALATLLLASPQRLDALRGVAAPRLLALSGAELPWVEGVEYFGREPGASWLLLPTERAPSVPSPWLERRYRRALPDAGWPCLLVPEPLTLVPVAKCAPVGAAMLAAWLEGTAR